MLSRVADNLYWMSRYLERAEHTARLVDVNLALALEQSPAASAGRWPRLLASLRASPPEEGEVDAYHVTWRLTFDGTNPSSVLTCIASARENARQVREQISSEMWEQVNRFYLSVRGATFDRIWRQPHEFLRSVREGVHFFQGLTESTMGHDEGWQFIQLGRYLERAVATVGLLSASYDALPALDASSADQTPAYLEWVGLLRSCTAFEAYSRARTADLRPERIAEFLLLDPIFPHSVRFSVDMIQAALQAIAEATGSRAADGANRLAGRLQATLRFSRIGEIMSTGLQRHLEEIEQGCLRVHAAIYDAYLAYPVEQAVIA